MKGHINIKDFKVGERIQGVYLIRTIHVKLTNSSNKKYLDINFSDKTGNINAKLWDLKDDYNDEFKENTLVKVKALLDYENLIYSLTHCSLNSVQSVGYQPLRSNLKLERQ